MPWLVLPFGDKAKKDLRCYFHVKGIPFLVITRPDGKNCENRWQKHYFCPWGQGLSVY